MQSPSPFGGASIGVLAAIAVRATGLVKTRGRPLVSDLATHAIVGALAGGLAGTAGTLIANTGAGSTSSITQGN